MVGVSPTVAGGAMEPHSLAQEAPPCTSAQVTPWFAGSCAATPVNSCVAFLGMSALPGLIETPMARKVAGLEESTEASVTDVAVTVMPTSLGGSAAGAV